MVETNMWRPWVEIKHYSIAFLIVCAGQTHEYLPHLHSAYEPDP